MIQVFLIDDHTIWKHGICSVLDSELDIKVIVKAFLEDEILEKVHQCAPDVIVLDINLRKKDGIEVISLVKNYFPNCKVLVLTMDEHYEHLMSAFQAGADGYLLKDTSSKQVVHAIRTVYHGNSIIHPSMMQKLINFRQSQKEFTLNKNVLTDREKEILSGLTKGMSNKEIANTLYISDSTVKSHMRIIFKKLNVNRRSQAVYYAIQNHLIPPY
ncbi:response regulator transcription factor [Paenisporosarcina sp. FSL H8-0542]|uniref:response regulator transcription factor n=1 Tax=Paenisporosarcina sp. FSL H8-0542 TaxID=2921401 RepID=UPI00315B153B